MEKSVQIVKWKGDHNGEHLSRVASMVHALALTRSISYPNGTSEALSLERIGA